jgi:hypothetical protein
MKTIYQFLFLLFLSAFLMAGSAVGAAREKSEQAAGATHADAATAMTLGTNPGHALAKPENIRGTISMVENNGDLFATGADGVPFSFIVTKRTQIEIAGQAAGLSDLKNEINKQASIEFVPMSNGNLIKTIDVSAS